MILLIIAVIFIIAAAYATYSGIFGLLTSTAVLSFLLLGAVCGIASLVSYFSRSKSEDVKTKSPLFLPLAIIVTILVLLLIAWFYGAVFTGIRD